jgi:hypothetical protein
MDRYEFHLTGFAEDLANLEAIHALLTQYRNAEVHIVVTVSPVPLMNTLFNYGYCFCGTVSSNGGDT